VIEYRTYTHDDKDAAFWADIGPFATSRDVHKALGGPIFDDARFEWVIAKEEGVVIGWGARVHDAEKKLVTVDWTYVVPEHRRRGIYTGLRERLLSGTNGTTVRGTSKNAIIQRLYEREGFAHTGSSGAWKRYERKGV